MGEDKETNEEIHQLLETIERHCQIGYILIDNPVWRHLFLPTILEDIYTFAQELPNYFIKDDGKL
jgi:hypothetical protein